MICLASSQAAEILESDCDPIFIENENCEAGDVCRRIIESVLSDAEHRETLESFDIYARIEGIIDADDFEAGRVALINSLSVFVNDGFEGSTECRRVCYVRDIAEYLPAIESPFLLDKFAEQLFDAWEMSAKEREICEEFNRDLFAALATKVTANDIAECLERPWRDRLKILLDEADTIDAKRSLLGKRDGRSSDAAFSVELMTK